MDTAFEILAEQHRPMLLAYARALINGQEHDAEDVVQDTLLAVHGSLATFDTGANVAVWLRGIIRNRARQSHRGARRRRTVVNTAL
ncbi:MAG: RNA polymerase sigma factor [Thermoguttaceae bacterium]|jgi:RNA polymerase sigma factor (sigma-70 family)